jgi:ribosome biogenesis SPOUT family RNA methylase Rps3
MEDLKQFQYIIEHFEEELSEWTLKEYTHMIMLLSGLYDKDQNKSRLIITNFSFTHLFKSGELKEDALNTLKHTEKFEAIRLNFGSKCLVSKFSFKDLTTASIQESISKDVNALKDDSLDILKLIRSNIQSEEDLNDVCFMDFRAEKELDPVED